MTVKSGKAKTPARPIRRITAASQLQMVDGAQEHTCVHSCLLTNIKAKATAKNVAAPSMSMIDIPTMAARLLKGCVAGGRPASDRKAKVT